jgi:hypothetical protein
LVFLAVVQGLAGLVQLLPHFSTSGAIGQTLALGLAVVLPVALMFPARTLPRAVS